LVFVTGTVVFFVIIASQRTTGRPSRSVGLPSKLPPDLRLVATEDWGCGSQVCSRRLLITGANGQSQTDVLAELRSQLTPEHGWTATAQRGEACRDGGRNSLIDSTCVIVEYANRGLVSMIVSEHSLW
jgi:hypothetical protein